jgi:S-adenosylmethionine/arginine decarboxylase-like enzyme
MNLTVKTKFLAFAEDLKDTDVLTELLQETASYKEAEKQQILNSLNQELQRQGIRLTIKQ